MSAAGSKAHFPIPNGTASMGIGGDGLDWMPKDLYMIDIIQKGFKYTEHLTIRTETEVDFDFLAAVEGWEVVLFSANSKNFYAYVTTDEDTIIHLSSWNSVLNFTFGGRDKDAVSNTRELIEKICPKKVLVRTPEFVPISFWSLGPRGAVHRDKKIQPLLWDNIRSNYNENTRAQIEAIRSVTPPLEGGRLVLWHGVPGTGKSSAIRNLVYEWLPWCDTSVVVDPENFFGSADYMLSVLLDTPSFEYGFAEEDDESDEDDASETFILQGKDRWNLLIIEDADEFINSDAKARTGQGLSRLLNLADGLIGQGMKFMILITTNEKIQNIHSAVGREGRCFAKTEFAAFNKAEAKEWLGPLATEIRDDPSGTFTLAQLFDKRREQQQIKTEVAEIATGLYV